eukprot:1215208-Rhodomonas_salina.2
MAGFQRSAPASWGNQGGDFNRESNPTFSQSSPLEQEALRAVAEYADAARFNQEANSSRPRGFAQQTNPAAFREAYGGGGRGVPTSASHAQNAFELKAGNPSVLDSRDAPLHAGDLLCRSYSGN